MGSDRGSQLGADVHRWVASVESLPRPARRLLQAAHHILRTHGFSKLSLQNIALEAGQHKASVGYYFGDKAGLVRAVAISVVSDALIDWKSELNGIADDNERIRAYLDLLHGMADNGHVTLEYQEILPAALRDATMRADMRRVYDWWREVNSEMIESGAAKLDSLGGARRVAALAAITTALSDGLAVQKALGVDSEILDDAWDEWTRVLLDVRRGL